MDVAEWYRALPVVTRTYVTLCVATTAACALDVSGVSCTGHGMWGRGPCGAGNWLPTRWRAAAVAASVGRPAT